MQQEDDEKKGEEKSEEKKDAPKDEKEAVPHLVSLPKEIATAMNYFTQFYFSKFTNSRQIHWKLSLGSAELRGNFNQKYEFMTSSY